MAHLKNKTKPFSKQNFTIKLLIAFKMAALIVLVIL